MTIKDNGFTFVKVGDPVVLGIVGKALTATGSLSELKDWFESALHEINRKIEDIG